MDTMGPASKTLTVGAPTGFSRSTEPNAHLKSRPPSSAALSLYQMRIWLSVPTAVMAWSRASSQPCAKT